VRRCVASRKHLGLILWDVRVFFSLIKPQVESIARFGEGISPVVIKKVRQLMSRKIKEMMDE